MKPTDDDGRELDARFSVEFTAIGLDLVIESRGGGKLDPRKRRNLDYSIALALHLKRMGCLGGTLMDVQVASAPAMRVPREARSLTIASYPYPIKLSAVADVDELRRAIGRAGAAFGQASGTKSGNWNKKLRLTFHWPPALAMTPEQIERLLAFPGNGKAVWTETPTDNREVLEKRVAQARASVAGLPKAHLPRPTGSDTVTKTVAAATRHVRDPNVVAWVLESAAGKCEVCDEDAPFRDVHGDPYLEVHHVRPLSEGGPDKVENAVACCPNCHRRLHHGHDRAALRDTVLQKIGRLTDYPAKNSTS